HVFRGICVLLGCVIFCVFTLEINVSVCLSVNLTNLQSNVAFYHVHDFPVRSLTNRCSNDSIGDHWNPFRLNRSSPTYPRVPGSTHDMYEVGDLSAKHGSIAGKNMVDMTFTDFNLPLFGKNSIVGRSVCNYNILHDEYVSCHLRRHSIKLYIVHCITLLSVLY
uniref:Superoxide dismutase copper/zinc binding domain-containing protein n=1 Tax=Pundamilia nyererei TaxID=303518 RepID=A0A3B4EY12_9CICH